jgi:hypothetical protein
MTTESAATRPDRADHAVILTPNEKGNPPGKLADAELHFYAGPLAGLKLIGFAVWERRSGGGQNVTFPARSYAVNGERRSFALLRPADFAAGTDTQQHIRDLIRTAWRRYDDPKIGAPGTVRSYYDAAGQLVEHTTHASAEQNPVELEQPPTKIGAPGTYTRDFPIDLPPNASPLAQAAETIATLPDSPTRAIMAGQILGSAIVQTVSGDRMSARPVYGNTATNRPAPLTPARPRRF